MTKDMAIIITISYIIAFFSFLKYWKIKHNIKHMQQITATCTDIIIRQNYKQKFYLYFYSYKLQHETSQISEKRRTPLMRSKIKINENYPMYINPQNESEYVSPIEAMTYNFYLFLTFLLIVLPLFLGK